MAADNLFYFLSWGLASFQGAFWQCSTGLCPPVRSAGEHRRLEVQLLQEVELLTGRWPQAPLSVTSSCYNLQSPGACRPRLKVVGLCWVEAR